MSDAISPTLYVIQSKINSSDWVLTVKGDSNYSLHLNHNTVDPRQLWVREEDAARGGFFLRNPFLDRCLRAGSSQGGTITMASKSMGDAELIWRKEQGDDWGCLNKLSDWEQKMNVAGNGPYDENTPIIQYEYDRGSDHELWKLVKYDPNFGPAVIIYEEGGQHLTLGGSDHSRRDEPRQPLLDCPVKLDCDLAYNHAENRDPFGQRYHTEYLVAHPDLWRQVRYRQGLRGQRERFGNRDAVDHSSNRRPVFSQRYNRYQCERERDRRARKELQRFPDGPPLHLDYALHRHHYSPGDRRQTGRVVHNQRNISV